MTPLGRTFLRAVLVLAAAAALLVPAVAAQTGAHTLEGEDLFVAVEQITVDFECDTEGVSTIEYSASGLATGPFYPGTFSLSGTITLGPQTFAGLHPPTPVSEGTVAGPVLTLDEAFTIISGATTITGTKTLHPDASVESGTQGTCQEVDQFPVLDFLDGQGTVVEVNANAQYDATIQEPAGTFHDSGLAIIGFGEIEITGSCPAGTCQARIGGFDQLFAQSDQLASTPGHANGGGKVAPNVTFAFHARRDESGPRGACNVVDHVENRHIKCLSVTSYVQVGNAVSIRGEALDDGLPTTYQIEAEDGPSDDVFAIETASGYAAGGPVTNGQVKVR